MFKLAAVHVALSGARVFAQDKAPHRGRLGVSVLDTAFLFAAQVAASAKPPKALGYLYLYRRNDYTEN